MLSDRIRIKKDRFESGRWGVTHAQYLRLIDAVIGDKRGETAAILAMSWPAPNYAVEFGIPSGIERRIKTSLTQLLRVVSECFDKA